MSRLSTAAKLGVWLVVASAVCVASVTAQAWPNDWWFKKSLRDRNKDFDPPATDRFSECPYKVYIKDRHLCYNYWRNVKPENGADVSDPNFRAFQYNLSRKFLFGTNMRLEPGNTGVNTGGTKNVKFYNG